MRVWESTTWLAIGATALATLAVLAALAAAYRVRRASGARQAGEHDDERLLEELRRRKAEAARARAELRWLRRLAGAGSADSLDGLLHQALQAAADLVDAAAAMLLLPRPDGEPLAAAFGLTAAEATRELPVLPPGGAEARAVALAYRYTEEELARDDFRLTGGLALALADPEGAQVGTLAVFWRRVEREATEDELERLESLAAALGPALVNALRFEGLRREADVDPETGLHGRRSLERSLERECARARRYGHTLTLLLLRIDAASADGLLRWAAERLAVSVRAPDAVFHVGGGRFAALLPEASRADAERLAARLEPALAATLARGVRAQVWTALAELGDADDAVSLVERAEEELARNEPRPGTTEPRRTAVDRGP